MAISSHSSQAGSVYTDFNSLDQLKHKVKSDSVDDLRAVAQQFEAIFIQQMMKTMRDASLSEGLFDSKGGDFYVDMLDKQMSLNLSKGRGIGLADIIVQQMSGTLKLTPEDSLKTDHSAPQPPAIPHVSHPHREDTSAKIEKTTTGVNPATNAKPQTQETPGLLPGEESENRQQLFIKNLWPLAVNAAKELGVKPHVLIAQAALETGWGQYIAKDENGNNSHNLFNIKAGSNWRGDTVTLSTTELSNGTPVKEFAAFRVYDSYDSSFEDYVALMKRAPRYQQVLANTDDATGYATALQKAGYATDPEYSTKILRVASQVSAALNSLHTERN